MKDTIKKTFIIAGSALGITLYLQNRDNETIQKVESTIKNAISKAYNGIKEAKENDHEL